VIDDLYRLSKVPDEEREQTKKPEFGVLAIDKYLSKGGQGDLMCCWRENFMDGAAYPYTLESKATEEELVVTMRSAIRHYGNLAMQQCSQGKQKGKEIE